MAFKIFDLRTPAVLKSEVKQFIGACESLISAIDRRTAFSQNELRQEILSQFISKRLAEKGWHKPRPAQTQVLSPSRPAPSL